MLGQKLLFIFMTVIFQCPLEQCNNKYVIVQAGCQLSRKQLYQKKIGILVDKLNVSSVPVQRKLTAYGPVFAVV